jgi:hypothetical protein
MNNFSSSRIGLRLCERVVRDEECTKRGVEPVQFLNLFKHRLDLFELFDDVGILSEVLFTHHLDHKGVTCRVSERERCHKRRPREGRYPVLLSCFLRILLKPQ